MTQQPPTSSSHPADDERYRRSGPPATVDEMKRIQEMLQGLRYGSLQIFVQDGVIVQIDRTEKRRIRRSSEDAAS